jgi:hypothetical protein
MDKPFKILAKIKYHKYRDSRMIEVDPSAAEYEMHRLADYAERHPNSFRVEDWHVTHADYGSCAVVSIPKNTGGPRTYALARIEETEETEIERLRAENRRLRERISAALALLEQES